MTTAPPSPGHRPPLWDDSGHSVLAGCAPPCAWRVCVADALTAARAWAEHYAAEHAAASRLGLRSRAKPRATACQVCGASAEQAPVEPFAGLCAPCRRAARAAAARAAYRKRRAARDRPTGAGRGPRTRRDRRGPGRAAS